MSKSDYEKIIERAVEFHRNGKLAQAANLCKNILHDNTANPEALNLLGVILCDAGLFQQSVDFFQRAIASGGPNSSVLYNYGVALRSVDRFLEASRAFKNAAEADPNRPEIWFNLGETYRRLNNQKEAIKALKKATALDQLNADAFHTLGNAYISIEDFEGATEAYVNALRLEPNNVETQNNLGIALRRSGKFFDAVKIFKNLLSKQTNNVAAYNNLGVTLLKLKNYPEAEAALKSALTYTPDYGEATMNIADLFIEIGKFSNAIFYLKRAIEFDTSNVSFKIKLGIVLQKSGRLKEAETLLRIQLEENDKNIGVSIALANVLRDRGNFTEACSILNSVLSSHPDHAGALANLALVYQHQGNLEQAEKTILLALEIEPENPTLHLNLAHLLLMGGKFRRGWKEFQWRLEENNTANRTYTAAQFYQDDINYSGKIILLELEQGIGDCFQFIRLVPDLAKHAKKIILRVPTKLKQILTGSNINYEVLEMDAPLPSYDISLPLLSLPFILKLDRVPHNEPYISAEQSLTRKWRNRLTRNKPNIGIAWQGSKVYENDYLRSIPFSDISQLFQLKSFSFTVIQKRIGQIKGENITDLGSELDQSHSFLDTAAVIQNLDLVVTSDTAIAHLAGALGKPVWVILNYSPDWRWMLGRSDSPWYPSMKLFRQKTPGNWAEVIKEVITALEVARPAFKNK
ncbi:MAG: tetratricopeptide repeat protein [Pseudomonadota bacterium]|nr:tetratricopeptide repeat protein [Pseudomonadota bacterium]